jgi:bifunctional UDP-N-acetylglucosamine pyrophosphorylase / glucosamine-1-phosphate N-acetyltransferase
MNYQIVILAAGKGSRMALDIPKVLVPLAGKPLIRHLLDEVDQLADIAKPIIVVGYKHPEVKKILGKGYSYALQEQQLGTAHAVWATHPKVDSPHLIVLNGDMPFIKAQSIRRLAQLHATHNSPLSIFTIRVPHFEGVYGTMQRFGRIIRNRYNGIEAIREYKDASPAEQEISELNPGIYVFSSDWLWDNIAAVSNQNARNEYYLTDLIALAIQQGHDVATLPIDPREAVGINTPQELAIAQRLVLASSRL